MKTRFPPGALGRSPPVRSRRPQHADRGLNAVEVSDWATAQGIEVKDHGPGAAELAARFSPATGAQAREHFPTRVYEVLSTWLICL
jgi:hypothetical protein